MKNWISLFFSVVSLCLLAACSEDDVNPGEPQWTDTYPQVLQGAVSADIGLSTTEESRVYWLIANQAIDGLNSEALRNEVTTPSDPKVKFHGTASAATSATIINVKNLAQNTKYFLYMVAENKTDSTLQANPSKFEFTTYKRQEQKEYNSTAESRKVQYLVYRPEEVFKHPEKKYPICFFLGGNGEIAAPGEINLIRNGTLAEFINKGNDVPMIVVSIQHTKSDWNVNLIDEGVVHALSTYPVDVKKVYMSGISGGGFGCWNYALNFSDKLAAIVPISGGGSLAKACNLSNMPVWAFHNTVDGTVAPTNSINMVNAIKLCPNKKDVTLFLFPDTGHDCWRRVYDKNHIDWKNKSPDTPKMDIYTWLISKSK